MNRQSFLAKLRRHHACPEGYAWARDNRIASPQQAWTELPRADWMLWLLGAFRAEYDRGALQAWTFGVADRAVRVHAVAALRGAGRKTEADTLAALAPITNHETARLVWYAAYAAYDVATERERQVDDLRAALTPVWLD